MPDNISYTQEEKDKLIALYAAMAKLTAPECAHVCRKPHSCCDAIYCDLTINWAKQAWGINLERVNGTSIDGKPLPLMGPSGCTAPPHLRPICTIHTCAINSIGCKAGDPQWTEQYFKLREEIEDLEWTDALERMEKGL